MNLRVFVLYGSFWPLGSRELAGYCSSLLGRGGEEQAAFSA